MKSLTLIGLALLTLSAVLFYFTTNFAVEQFKLSHLMGIIGGIGIGLILGGMVGYVSKGTAMREEEKRRAYRQLQLEKAELEKQAAELAAQRAVSESEVNIKKDTYL